MLSLFTHLSKRVARSIVWPRVKHNVAVIDLLGPMMDLLENKIKQKPLEQPGIVHQLDDYYFKKSKQWSLR